MWPTQINDVTPGHGASGSSTGRVLMLRPPPACRVGEDVWAATFERPFFRWRRACPSVVISAGQARRNQKKEWGASGVASQTYSPTTQGRGGLKTNRCAPEPSVVRRTEGRGNDEAKDGRPTSKPTQPTGGDPLRVVAPVNAAESGKSPSTLTQRGGCARLAGAQPGSAPPGKWRTPPDRPSRPSPPCPRSAP